MPKGIYNHQKGNTNGFKKGQPSWNKGKITSIETREKQKLAKLKNPVRYWLNRNRPSMFFNEIIGLV